LRLEDFAARPEYAPWTLVKTTDGGRTWQAVARACPFGTTATAISFVDSSTGWQLRTRQPGAGQQLRELLATKDGGLHWRRVAGTLSPNGIATGSKDGLGIGGYPASLFFLPDGHGWIGLNYAASVIATRDAGRTWQPAGRRLSNYGAGPVWFLDDRDGFAIAGSGVHFSLVKTRDGGRSWTTVHRWGETTERAPCEPGTRFLSNPVLANAGSREPSDSMPLDAHACRLVGLTGVRADTRVRRGFP
jgi:photosystem II stability/assembly factor-like uncharacterized protein